MKTSLNPGEELVRKGGANLQRGAETVGGHLYLTTERLVFESHAFNVQVGATSIALQDVVGVAKCWTKLLGVVPVTPNSIRIDVAGRESERIVLWRRGEWVGAIDGARRGCSTA